MTDREFMLHFRCVEAEDMHNQILAQKVRYFKETEGGREEMCKVMEDMRNQAVNEERMRIVMAMLKQKMSCELIAEISGLPVADIQKLANSANA